jgi:hypothetical protein
MHLLHKEKFMRPVLTFLVLAGCVCGADDPKIAAFTQRVEQFVKIRNEAKQKAGSLPKASTPEQIQAAERKMLEAIRTARADAKQGDIFTPDIQPLFRQILKDNLSGADKEKKESRQTARQGNPQNDKEKGEAAPVVGVNAAYPKSAPLSSVPPLLLLQLPKLPTDIEYRFVGETLILWDNISNVILDYMKGAAPGV